MLRYSTPVSGKIIGKEVLTTRRSRVLSWGEFFRFARRRSGGSIPHKARLHLVSVYEKYQSVPERVHCEVLPLNLIKRVPNTEQRKLFRVSNYHRMMNRKKHLRL